MATIISSQQEFRQPIPTIIGNVDYLELKKTLERMSEIIKLSGLDSIVMQHAVDEAEQIAMQNAEKKGIEFKGLKYKEQARIQKKAKQSLRFAISRKLLDEGYRSFSSHLADSPLLQRFCILDSLGVIGVPSKSSIERYEKDMPEEMIRELVAKTIKKAKNPVLSKTGQQQLLLEKEISMTDYYLDSTCVKANIHFPVDWILFRDATRTIMKAVKLIREQGLKNRMQEPSEFIKKMNKLCIQMTHANNRKDSKKKRKYIVRKMKKLAKKVILHGEKHKNLLDSEREHTKLSEKQAKRIIERIDNVLNKLPEASRQSHERIIGERLVKNKDKILSLYDEDVHVIIRGKVDAKIEFGNTLFLGEQQDGLIIDWKLYKDTAPADNKQLPESLGRLEEYYDGYKPDSVSTDRGFDSKTNKKLLKKNNIKNFMCPRSVIELQDSLKDEDFCNHQKRRGQTEARIGILKNNFLGKPLKSKGFKNREQSVAWGILSHNLWALARLPHIKAGAVKLKKAA